MFTFIRMLLILCVYVCTCMCSYVHVCINMFVSICMLALVLVHTDLSLATWLPLHLFACADTPSIYQIGAHGTVPSRIPRGPMMNQPGATKSGAGWSPLKDDGVEYHHTRDSGFLLGEIHIYMAIWYCVWDNWGSSYLYGYMVSAKH